MSELGLSPIAAGDPNLSVADARAAIAAALRPIDESEQIPLAAALGRVLAFDVLSPIDVPGHDNSAMDGFAFRGSDIASRQATVLRIVGIALAGAPYP
ncbi:MAG: molybdopterin molybdenumtransferase MoeA, partial [Pseudomonadota bacterium]|nr:molybdopterin molybdenumtransferase MoeA [Pseudomonadota bacterium]